MVYSQFILILFTVLNLIFYLNAQYVGEPTTTADLKAILKHSLELKCKYNGDGKGEFIEWYADDKPISKEKSGHYVVRHKDDESTLVIKIFVLSDAQVKNWHVKTKKTGYEDPAACQFGQIALQPSPQRIETGRRNEVIDSAHGSIRRNEGDTVDFICVIVPNDNTTNNQQIKWEYGKDDNTYSDIPDDITVTNEKLTINPIKKGHRGYYRCTLNDVSFTVLLRVKDRLAALWPFIGIVSVVVVLVIIILIFEKRQKSNKKSTATDDDEQDQTKDPLVRSTAKGSDNDTKKRNIKT